MATIHPQTTLSLLLSLIILLLLNTRDILADVPVSCEYPNVYGEWTFEKTQTIYTRDVIYNQCSIDKSGLPQVQLETFSVALRVPDIALLKKDNKIIGKGRWTLIWNQGMEIRFTDYRYFAFFNYTIDSQGVATSHCERIMVGTYHDNSVNALEWGCFIGRRVKVPKSVNQYFQDYETVNSISNEKVDKFQSNERPYEDSQFVSDLNTIQTSWKASINDQFKGMTIGELEKTHLMKKRRNSQSSREFIESEMIKKGRNGIHHGYGKFIFNGEKDRYEWMSNEEIKEIPEEFSWDNVNGINYLTPVRNQFSCGSCYAFGTSEMLGMRVRIKSNLTRSETFSPQAIVNCSPYSQGCNGGCVYLASKYTQDYGLVLDECLPYNETMKIAQTCTINSKTRCKKVESLNYYNVGGYYGASNEENIMLDVLNQGPTVVGFMVYTDFFYYKNGIYTHKPETVNVTNQSRKLPKFYYINHVLIIYGWGIDKTTGQKYWKIQNSWGDKWGMSGRAFIAKGDNTCFIESDAESAIPIMTNI